MNNIYQRIAKLENALETQRSELIETLVTAYSYAVENKNEEESAYFARKIRNKLLEDSDTEIIMDRMNLDTSSPDNFIKSLDKVLHNEWSAYRQALRDLPQQAGFPLETEFPKSPKALEASKDGVANG